MKAAMMNQTMAVAAKEQRLLNLRKENPRGRVTGVRSACGLSLWPEPRAERHVAVADETVLSPQLPCPWGCNAVFCSYRCMHLAIEQHHALLCPARWDQLEDSQGSKAESEGMKEKEQEREEEEEGSEDPVSLNPIMLLRDQAECKYSVVHHQLPPAGTCLMCPPCTCSHQ